MRKAPPGMNFHGMNFHEMNFHGMNFRAPHWHGSDGKAARGALATAAGKIREFSQILGQPWDHRNRIPLELWICRKKWWLKWHLYWQNTFSAWPAPARSWSLNFIISAETKHPWQEFLKIKHWGLWGSHINSCWIPVNSGYEGSWLGEKGEHSNPRGSTRVPDSVLIREGKNMLLLEEMMVIQNSE